MINYQDIWDSINSESNGKTLKSQIARRIPSNGFFNVFLATDFRKGTRLLLIKLENNHGIITDNLPRFRGLEISINVTSLGEFNNSEFLKITQSIPSTDNIFELVISDLCEKIIQLDDITNFNDALIRVLNSWKIFFEEHEDEILSIEIQKGLIGELHFLKDYLFQKYSFIESLFYWTGSERTNHDFQIINHAVEVKTTASKQHKRITISSERQLDNSGLEHLYLALFSLSLHSNMPNRTLPALIREISELIQEDPIASFQFQLKLAKYGYNRILAEKYTIGFSVLEMKYFEVMEGFPRLLQNDVPNGVGDLKYSIMLSACLPFEIKTEITTHI